MAMFQNDGTVLFLWNSKAHRKWYHSGREESLPYQPHSIDAPNLHILEAPLSDGHTILIGVGETCPHDGAVAIPLPTALKDMWDDLGLRPIFTQETTYSSNVDTVSALW